MWTCAIGVLMLTLESISDLRTKSISVIRLLIYILGTVVANLILKYQSIWSILGGMAVGIVMLVYAFASHEGIGYGDCIIFIVLGALLGFKKNMLILLVSLALAAICGGIYAVVKKKNLKTDIPFIPFVLIAFLCMNLWEVYS